MSEIKGKLLIALFVLSSILQAQVSSFYNSNIWYFGKYAGLNFNAGYPIAVYGGQTNTVEGVATICDPNGNLLFYTEGTKIWNRFHQLMPNGTGLLGHFSATQSSIIVPDLNINNKFYVFTVDAVENHLQNGFRYSIVDMTLNNGLGDVVPSQKNILLHSPVCEKVTAILDQNETGYWILTHEWNSNAFYAYHLTVNGLDTVPVVSNCGSIHSGGAYPNYAWLDGWLNAEGYLRPNRSGTKLAVLRYRAPLELFDFDRGTGQVSNPITAPIPLEQSSVCEFSPDQSKLYVSTISSALATTNYIYQFDLSQPNPLNNVQVLVHLTDGNEPSGIQIGPDGNVYVSEFNASNDVKYLSRIDNPDLPIPYSTYVRNAVPLTNDASAKRGLPNLYYYKGFQFITEVNKNEINENVNFVFKSNLSNSTFLFKNPFNEKILIKIYDVSGKMLEQFLLSEKEEKEETLNYNNGIYLSIALSDKHIVSQKFSINN
ncbi:MAG TPA: hypothetical protein PLP65_05590 [Bacteroidales bacterium]|nr:hypothetical protein [Bacteroidales bacterium]